MADDMKAATLRVLVCGGRKWASPEPIVRELLDAKPDVVIHGGAPGADTMAGKIAKAFKVPVEVYAADWEKFGRRAGFIRNVQMIDSKPDLVLAFGGGRDTAHTVMLARQAGIPVKEINA